MYLMQVKVDGSLYDRNGGSGRMDKAEGHDVFFFFSIPGMSATTQRLLVLF